jgi:hypothetical protein
LVRKKKIERKDRKYRKKVVIVVDRIEKKSKIGRKQER